MDVSECHLLTQSHRQKQRHLKKYISLRNYNTLCTYVPACQSGLESGGRESGQRNFRFLQRNSDDLSLVIHSEIFVFSQNILFTPTFWADFKHASCGK